MADQMPATPTTTADVANAKNQNEALSQIQSNLASNVTAQLAALAAIQAAITNSMLGGKTGTSANRLLRSKGTSGLVVQNTPVTCDDSGNLSGIGTLGATTVNATTVNATTVAASTTLTLNGVGAATLNTNTWAQQQGFAQATLTAASTVTWNGQTQQTAKITLDSTTVSLGAISNAAAGFTYVLEIVQDATGGRALALTNAIYTWPSGTVPTISTAANAVDVLTCYYDGSKMRCSLQKAFA